jgi:hypothetical protein
LDILLEYGARKTLVFLQDNPGRAGILKGEF